ncbi:UNVERIFIED_CONTAM: radical SAM superfamily enzyme YgiQ (UPF0313 family) [Acetivibrio alkalicellulosi]
MKTLIIAINTKHIHSSLAPWYLKASCKDECREVKVLEFSINDNLDNILGSIYVENCQVVAFSCYIWNIQHVLKIADNLKKISPNIKIILGGPEVSYDAQNILKDSPYIDYIISGEGETSFRQLLKMFIDNSVNIEEIQGIIYKKNNLFISNGQMNLIKNLDDIPMPYSEDMLGFVKDKIVYYEASRGCPFSCSYCISSTFEGVRYFSMERVKKDLTVLLRSGVKLIKFVDRTFNCNKKRAVEIFEFAINNSKNTCFHFEVAADLFDDEIIEVLSKSPKGIIQFEIGIQSTNRATLEAVRRRTDIDRVFYYVKKLLDLKNIHIHLDLIAGLPFEDLDSFKNSFNQVYQLRPHKLQLGFLKMLKGSGLRKEFNKYNYLFRDYPPYEVLENKFLSFNEMVKIKEIEHLVDKYFNSSRFCKTLDYIVKNFYSDAFEFYEILSSFYKKKDLYSRPLSSRDLYTVMLDFIDEMSDCFNREIIIEIMKFDFIVSHNTNNLPVGLKRIQISEFKEKCFEFLKSTDNIKKYLPEYIGVPAKSIYKNVHFEPFGIDVDGNSEKCTHHQMVIIIDYKNLDSVSGRYSYKKIFL